MKKYWILFKTDLQRMFEYRIDNLIYALTNITVPLVSLGLWLAISSSGTVLVYSQQELILYFLLAIWVKSITFTWADYFLEENILKGSFANYLLKPLSAVEYFAIHNLSEKLFRGGIISLVVVILGIILLPNLSQQHFSPQQVLLFFVTLVLASVMNFLLDVIIGLTTFWLHEVEFTRSTSDLLNQLFSGKIIPLAFLPVGFYQIAVYLPFRYTFSLPIEIVLGRLNPTELYFALAAQLVWLVIIFLTYKVVLKYGLKAYQGYGV